MAPLRGRLEEPAFERLVQGLSLLSGIEAVIVLRDVCGQDNAGIEATACWIARVLVEASERDG
jgi:hypothetical protein